VILVIESDDGAGWYVTNQLEDIDLTSSEGKDILAKMVSDTIEQIKTEMEEYNRIADDVDSNLDNTTEGEAEYATDDLLISPIKAEIRLSDLDEADIFNEDTDPRDYENPDWDE
jgi:hypothetical protein